MREGHADIGGGETIDLRNLRNAERRKDMTAWEEGLMAENLQLKEELKAALEEKDRVFRELMTLKARHKRLRASMLAMVQESGETMGCFHE
jgi:hypothetical protein